MTLLSDRDLLAARESGALAIDPWEPDLVQPASVDVRLDRWFRVFDNTGYTHIDPSREQELLTRLHEVPENGSFVLHPGEFALACTFETVTLSDKLAARLEGKSSLGRLGLLTHSTAGFIDPGFSGQITLELSNAATLPIVLWPGMKIGQLCVLRMSSEVLRPYGAGATGSQYQGQVGPTPSRSWVNWRTWHTGTRLPPVRERPDLYLP
jgi:dCTP deaminase